MSSFKPSTRVEAWPIGYNGWYSAKCLARNPDGTYRLLFDDMEMVEALDPTRVRANTVIKVGTKVAVLYERKWVSCAVSRVDGSGGNEMVSVKFSNGEEHHDLTRADLMFPPHNSADAEAEGAAAVKLQAVWRSKQVQKQNLLSNAPAASSGTASQSSTTANDEDLHVTDPVTVNYHGSGNFYNGKISAVVPGTEGELRYDVVYDDGDVEPAVPRERIKLTKAAISRPPSMRSLKSPTPLKVADLVSVDYHGSGNFYPGKIANLKTVNGVTQYDIVYEDGDVEPDVPRKRIVVLTSAAVQSVTAAVEQERPTTTSSQPSSSQPSSSQPSSSQSAAKQQNTQTSKKPTESVRKSKSRPSSRPKKRGQKSAESLSEARRLMRSALGLDLLVEWISCWTNTSTADASASLEQLTHPKMSLHVPKFNVCHNGLSDVLSFHSVAVENLGTMYFVV